MIGSLRQLASMAGRAVALLAAVLVALTPVLPAHAHAHLASGEAAIVHVHAQGVAHHAHAPAVAHHHDASDADAPTPLPHAADCCFVCHAPVIPVIAAVPMPPALVRGARPLADRTAPPDAPAERLPEPPRPSA